ncbi:MAG: hypothetical protein A2Y57_03405 [Candidatus Woykebacteria bacterium RBG_13_40_7b]|uniref:Uncharacterized protein n=1 Tax=Candidatus Woykebacteria bacterium RBG_13_40_7b TaxID=1802594 RepID=A0A1G1W9L6_9BACT|nr:MAG: hypothetical protein A2Y57_03405 [Candidatus Woykebacteria bacterium RBG_13_40_7b]
MITIPHGDYPRGKEPFNVIKMLPELFSGIDFKGFANTIGVRRFGDFLSSQLFLCTSQYQSNYGAKLVMLLSAIERANGTWKPLELVLRGREFRRRFRACKDAKEAEALLDSEIDTYTESFGSIRKILSFYRENLTKEQKQKLVYGIGYGHTYEKKAGKDLTIFTPVRLPSKKFDTETEELDYELARRLKYVVYDFRNGFVHNASYLPFPDRKYIEKRRLFTYDRFEGEEIKDQWVITMTFETFHELTRLAFVEYWKKEFAKDNK